MPDRQDDLNPASDLAPFADALQRLAPQPPHLSRDALLFEAGKAAAQPRLAPWVWPTATGVFAATALVLGAFVISPTAPSVQYTERVVYVPAPEPAPLDPTPTRPEPIAKSPKPKPKPSPEESEAARMLQVRRDVLRWGVEMLPESKAAGGGGRTDDVAEFRHWLSLRPGVYALPALQPKKPTKSDEEDEE